MEARSKELYQKILTMDLGGRTASYYDEDLKATIPYVEAADFYLAQSNAMGRKPDPAPLTAFIKNHPDSKFVKTAYTYLGYYYGQMAPKEDADAFFEEYTAKYPDDKNALRSYVQRIIKDKGPVDKGVALAEKLKESTGYPQDPDVQESLASLYALKDDPAKADEEYGKDFIDNYVSTTISALAGYANFWLDQDKNLDSVEETADILAAELGAARDVPSYYLSQAAGIFGRLKKTDKALALYGPAYAKKNWDDANSLASYAGFWQRQGANLENAREAAQRSVDMAPDYYNNFILAQVLFKLKSYDEALKAAEKAVELVKPVAAKNAAFSVQRYEKLVQDIREAMAKK